LRVNFEENFAGRIETSATNHKMKHSTIHKKAPALKLHRRWCFL